MANQYVDNKKFFEAMVNYREARIDAEESGEDPPKIPDYIGKCILDISRHLSYKANFVGYPFREEMIGDGVENAVKALNNFDPSKSNNPFAYFTRIIYFAFLRRIAEEKKELYAKCKLYTSMTVMGELYDDSNSLVDLSDNQSNFSTEYMDDFVKEYEKSMEKKKIPKEEKKVGVELFYNEKQE